MRVWMPILLVAVMVVLAIEAVFLTNFEVRQTLAGHLSGAD
jgi:hypothetical protein